MLGQNATALYGLKNKKEGLVSLLFNICLE